MTGCCFLSLFVYSTALAAAAPMALHACNTKDPKKLHRSLLYLFLWNALFTFAFPLLDPVFNFLPYHLWGFSKMAVLFALLPPRSPFLARVVDDYILEGLAFVENHYEEYGQATLGIVFTAVLKPVQSKLKCVVRKLEECLRQTNQRSEEPASTRNTDATISSSGCCATAARSSSSSNCTDLSKATLRQTANTTQPASSK